MAEDLGTGRREGIAVIIATKGRKDQVVHLLQDLARQSLRPTEVVVSATEAADVPDCSHLNMLLRVVIGQAGLTRQRNAGLSALTTNATAVAFLDDDLRLHRQYLERAEAHFRKQRFLSGLNGFLLADGASAGAPVSQAQAEILLSRRSPPSEGTLEPRIALYGCNMVVRLHQARETRFDERLPLYGWLEDRDFGLRLAQFGRMCTANDMLAVHLGAASGGRTSHVRFGYSQIANPLYLGGKGVLTRQQKYSLVARALTANSLRAGLKRSERSWRLNRLAGNSRAVADLLRGRLRPEQVLKFD